MPGEWDDFELDVTDTLTGFLGLFKVRRRHLQPGLRRGAANEAQQHREGAQHESCPGRRDLAEQPMLDRVPLRRPRRIVAHRDLPSAGVREVRQPLREPPRPRRVASARVRLDPQAFRLGRILKFPTSSFFLASSTSRVRSLRRVGPCSRPIGARLCGEAVRPESIPGSATKPGAMRAAWTMDRRLRSRRRGERFRLLVLDRSHFTGSPVSSISRPIA